MMDAEAKALRVKARAITNSAIRSGKLKRKPCQKCGATRGVQVHHLDYTKPLKIRWLCTRHHGQAHVGDKKIAGPRHPRKTRIDIKPTGPIRVVVVLQPDDFRVLRKLYNKRREDRNLIDTLRYVVEVGLGRINKGD